MLRQLKPTLLISLFCIASIFLLDSYLNQKPLGSLLKRSRGKHVATARDNHPITRDYQRSIGTKFSESFPDVELVDHHGQSHRFRSDLIEGKICCLAFFYTQCQGSCPGTIQKMKLLGEQLNAILPAIPVQFVAITLTPNTDDVPALKAYAENQGLDEAIEGCNWRFCTGQSGDLEKIRFALGLYDLDPEVDEDRTNHAAMIVFGNDATNRWTALPAGLSSDDLLDAFRRLAGNTESERYVRGDQDDELAD